MIKDEIFLFYRIYIFSFFALSILFNGYLRIISFLLDVVHSIININTHMEIEKKKNHFWTIIKANKIKINFILFTFSH